MSSTAAVPVKTLMITVFESVIEVFLLCLAGYTLSRAGVTDKATQRKLNVINVSLFTPALLFSKVSGNFPITYKLKLKVAYSLTPAKLKEMWVIPLAFVVVSGLSAGVAWGLAKAFGLKKSQTAFAMCASMFQNSNSLPIALIQSLVVEVPHLKWGDDDTKDQMLGRALTYMVLYSTLGMMLRWSLGVKLLSQADEEVEDIDSVIPPHAQLSLDHPVQSPDAMQPHPGAQETDPFFTTAHGIAQDELDERSNPGGSLDVVKRNSRAQSPSPSTAWQPSAPGSAHSMHPPEFRRLGTGSTRRDGSAPPATRRHSTKSEQGREFWGLPEQPRRQRILLSPEPEEDSSEEEVEEEEWASLTPRSLRRRNVSGPPSSRLRAFGITVKRTAKTALKGVSAFMTVPMYAALLSIFIALIPPLQAAMAKVKPLEQAIRSAGQCSIPVTLVVLGAFFYSPPPSPSAFQAPPAQSYPERSPPLGFLERKFRAIVPSSDSSYPGENKTVFVAVVSRMVIVPLLLLPVVAIIAKFDLFEAAEDPVFILSAVLLISSPPALTLAQITQAASGDAFERLISKTISLSYAVLTPPLTLIYVVIGLVFGRL